VSAVVYSSSYLEVSVTSQTEHKALKDIKCQGELLEERGENDGSNITNE